MVVVWLNSDKELPSDNEKVLVVYGDEIKTATFEKGISVEEHDKEVIFYFERCKNDQRESD